MASFEGELLHYVIPINLAAAQLLSDLSAAELCHQRPPAAAVLMALLQVCGHQGWAMTCPSHKNNKTSEIPNNGHAAQDNAFSFSAVAM